MTAPRKFDPAGPQELVDAFETRATVDMLAIVTFDVERGELRPVSCRPEFEEVVKSNLPGPGVDRSCVGQDPVEVEQDRPKPLPVPWFHGTFGPEGLGGHSRI
jgi:hypothetical protein